MGAQMSGGFLGRWSQRKLTRKQEEEARRQAGDSPGEAGEGTVEPNCDIPPQDHFQEKSAAAQNEDVLSEEELAALPPIDSITRETDIRAFMRKGVPTALKTAALRKMWLADPAIRNHVDYAVDYAWDWNTPGGVPGNSGRIAGESVAKMLDSVLPKPVSEKKQVEGKNAEISDSVPAEEPAAALPETEMQSKGDPFIVSDDAQHAMPGIVTGGGEEPGANRRLTEPVSRESATRTAETDAALKLDGDAPIRPRRHGGAVPL